MNLRFNFNFEEVEKKLLRKNKSLRNKNKYALREVEDLVRWIQENWTSQTAIGLTCYDTQEGDTLAFDSIRITPFSLGGNIVSVMSEIEKQLLSVDPEELDDPNALILAINGQLKQESQIIEENARLQKDTDKVKKKNKKSFNKFFNNKDANNLDEDDLLELEEEKEKEDLTVNISEEPVEEDLTFGNDDLLVNQDTEQSHGENKEIEEVNISHEPYEEKQTQFEEQSDEGNYTYPVPVSIKKHETVNLIPFEDYMDIGRSFDETIGIMTQKLSPESLFSFVGISSQGITNTKVEKYRIEYVQRSLSEAKFEQLREHYKTESNRIVGKAVSSLKEGVMNAWNEDYEGRAESELASQIEELQINATAKVQEHSESQSEIYRSKLNKLKTEQEIALQNFLRNQEAEQKLLEATESERLNAVSDSFRSRVEKELKESTEKLMDDKMFKLKSHNNMYLVEGKSQIIEESHDYILQANADVWSKAMIFVNEIKVELEEKTPSWIAEINEYNTLEEQEHRREKEKEELKLQSEALEIERIKSKLDFDKMKKLAHDLEIAEVKIQTLAGKNEILEMQVENEFKLRDSLIKKEDKEIKKSFFSKK